MAQFLSRAEIDMLGGPTGNRCSSGCKNFRPRGIHRKLAVTLHRAHKIYTYITRISCSEIAVRTTDLLGPDIRAKSESGSTCDPVSD